MSRYPLEGYRERCGTDVVLGTRFAKKPLELKIPVTIAGMSFGALSAPAKEALGRGATEVGTSTTTGDGGMTAGGARALEDARLPGAALALRHEPRRPAARGRDRGRRRPGRQAGRRRDAARPQDLRPRRGRCATCRRGSTSAARAAIRTGRGPDDLEIKIHELREITDWEKPIFVKVGATRTYYDVQLAVKAGADVIVVDGMQGGTAATQDVFIEHVGIPTLAGDAARRRRAPGARHAPEGAADRLRRHPHRRRRREGARARRRRSLDRHGCADRDGRQQPRVRRGVPRRSAARPASTTTGRRAAIPAGSRRRTTSSRRGSTLCSAAAGSRTTCACSRSRRRRSRARAASRMCTTSSPRISSR